MRDEYDHVDTEFGPYTPSDTVSADFARQLERELNEVTKQRNALTEALIAAQGALNPLSGFTKIKDNRYLQIVRDKVREALKTTKGEKP